MESWLHTKAETEPHVTQYNDHWERVLCAGPLGNMACSGLGRELMGICALELSGRVCEEGCEVVTKSQVKLK